MNYRDFFKGKKVAVVGLGPHGEMVADIKFLLRLDARVSFYDIRSERRLGKYMSVLRGNGQDEEEQDESEEEKEQGGKPEEGKQEDGKQEDNKQTKLLEKCVFGKVPAADLAEAELIILSPEISRKALFLKKATEAEIPIEYPDILFLKLAPAITLVGVMGACGKSTVSQMIYGMLKQSFAEYENQGLFFIDPDSGNGALTHLKKIKPGDVVLSRIPEEMMHEYYAARISPHVAVITSLTSSALDEARDAFGILEFQTYNNFIVAPDTVVDAIKKQTVFTPKAKMIRMRAENSALALQAAELFKVRSETAEKVLQGWRGLKGRQEMIKKVSGIEFYNDGASVTPGATLFALRSFSVNRNLVLILGGAYTGYDYGELVKEIPLYANTVVLLPGSATLGFREAVEKLSDIAYVQAPDLEEAVHLAKEHAKKGDRILFSPGCGAIGIDLSRRDRGERFVRAVRSL